MFFAVVVCCFFFGGGGGGLNPLDKTLFIAMKWNLQQYSMISHCVICFASKPHTNQNDLNLHHGPFLEQVNRDVVKVPVLST